MKRLASLLLASALALTAAGCAGQNPAASTQSGPPEAVESGKSSVAYVEELRIGTTAAIDGANVMTENGIFGKLNYNAVVTAPFVVTDENGKVQPFFMTGWELSGDLNTITATFATDQGLTWHDGEPVTMDDVVFTFQYLIDRKSSYCSGLTGVEAVNETTATLTLTDGKAFTMLNSMANFVTLRPEHVWSKVEGEYAEYTGEDAAIGCGPYKLTGVDEEAQSMTLEAVSDTYMGQELTVRKLTVRTYDSHDALVMALRSGEVDAMYDYSNSLNATMVDSITGVEGLDPGMSDNPGNYQLVFGFNEQPTDDLIFRKAVRAALDYELLRVTIGGEDGQIPTPVSWRPPIRALTARCPSWLRTWTKPTPCWMRAVMWMLTATAGGICPTAAS